jgi:hypothetical protein
LIGGDFQRQFFGLPADDFRLPRAVENVGWLREPVKQEQRKGREQRRQRETPAIRPRLGRRVRLK